jgi:hypothetical protein
MTIDPRLTKVRDKDEIIGTFNVRSLSNQPDFVNSTYLEHTETHMSMGDISDYSRKLITWAKVNKGSVIGAIVGDYGYGKTSTAIHLWSRCEKENILSIPPFEWKRLSDILDGIYCWTKYRLEQISPDKAGRLFNSYEKFREKSVSDFAKQEKMEVSKGSIWTISHKTS